MTWSLALAVLVVLAWAAWVDLRTREVPNWIPLSLTVVAACAVAFGWTSRSWSDLAVGSLIGFSVPAVLYFLGAMGGGDVKLLGALGALLGPVGTLNALVWIGLAGGALAIVSLCRKQREYAYVPAIAVGLLLHLIGFVGFRT
jgi:prepilin peptidase CpaA